MTNAEILRVAMEQCAADMSCSPEDFTRANDVVNVSRYDERAMAYRTGPALCMLQSFGSNVVAACDENLTGTVRELVTLFTGETDDRYDELTISLAKLGYIPTFECLKWLPDVNALRTLPCKYETQVLERGEFDDLYTPEWDNALSPTRPHLDMLAVGAYDGGKLIGLSGCSADCSEMWQIGIDVLPEYRRRGIAAALTSRLTVEILERGKVPFYSCYWANLGSTRNAYASGFRPAWMETHFSKATSEETK